MILTKKNVVFESTSFQNSLRPGDIFKARLRAVGEYPIAFLFLGSTAVNTHDFFFITR